MIDQPEQIETRLKQLELIEFEYERLKQLMDRIEAGHNLQPYTEDIVLYVDQQTLQIMDANPHALEFLGYSLENLRSRRIDELEILSDPASAHWLSYRETSIDTQVYLCSYRHNTGFQLPVRVYRRLLTKEGRPTLHYALEDLSLGMRIVGELNRREDADYQFREKLKILNTINIELSGAQSLDELCRLSIELGIGQLGFDRLSLWFLDSASSMMIGSFGVDEQGSVRDERGQSWSFVDTYVMDILSGTRDIALTKDEAPIYNDKTEIVGYGWHIAVPLLSSGQVVGVMMADNFLNRQPMKNYQVELLRLYGATVGNLAALRLAKQREFDLHLEQERVRMLESFITDVGHEFKTPLSIINTKSYLIQKVGDETGRGALVKTVQEQVMVINSMIDDMLYLVRLGSGLELNLKPVDLKEFMQQVVQESASLATARQLLWDVERETSCVVAIDTVHLKRALREIIHNAIQYTEPDGQITILLSQYEHEVGICVQDTGIGIASAHLDKIFNRLYRVDQARSQRGTGLGLSIAKLLVEAHQGKITVESVLGRGSTFEIRLPRP